MADVNDGNLASYSLEGEGPPHDNSKDILHKLLVHIFSKIMFKGFHAIHDWAGSKILMLLRCVCLLLSQCLVLKQKSVRGRIPVC